MTAAQDTSPGTNLPAIDLRSDTVTRPTPAMIEAMSRAEVGDDVYDGDPTVARLEARVAEMLGLEAGLFLPSGTQSNLTALLAHCGRGEEYIAGEGYHIYSAEAGGAAVLGGISPCPLPTRADGTLDPAAIEAAIKPDDFHCPITRLVCLENTHHGKAIPASYIREVVALARDRDLSVHIDGARLMNAAVALGEDPAVLVGGADSVSLCLSKGLGAPVGSVLSGSKAFIARGRRIRKMVGGGMRQSGVLAACGLVALEQHIDRLAEDHATAAALAAALDGLPGVTVEKEAAATNMVYIALPPDDHGPLTGFLGARGIRVDGPAPRLRLVAHLDLPADTVPRVAETIRDYFAQKAAA